MVRQLGRCVHLLVLTAPIHAFVISPIVSSLSQFKPIYDTPLFAAGRPANTLKPASIPLMDAGKALARSGELVIEVTSELNIYGGALSAAGALLRNAGDCVAQAAASCRFKTGLELVCDELRESATCLTEGANKLGQAETEAQLDENTQLATTLIKSITPVSNVAIALEAAGRSIMQGATVMEIGEYFVTAGIELELLSIQLRGFVPTSPTCSLAGQRMAFGAERMRDAGYALTGKQPELDHLQKGTSWIKS